MGRRFYLSDPELALIRDAVVKWDNWTTDDRTDEEDAALASLTYKGVL